MSYVGKLQRGLKWSMFKNIDGTFPKNISESEKANDLNDYLDLIKGKSEEEIKTINNLISEISVMGRTAKKRTPQYKQKLEKLLSYKNKTSQEKKKK